MVWILWYSHALFLACSLLTVFVQICKGFFPSGMLFGIKEKLAADGQPAVVIHACRNENNMAVSPYVICTFTARRCYLLNIVTYEAGPTVAPAHL